MKRIIAIMGFICITSNIFSQSLDPIQWSFYPNWIATGRWSGDTYGSPKAVSTDLLSIYGMDNRTPGSNRFFYLDLLQNNSINNSAFSNGITVSFDIVYDFVILNDVLYFSAYNDSVNTGYLGKINISSFKNHISSGAPPSGIYQYASIGNNKIKKLKAYHDNNDIIHVVGIGEGTALGMGPGGVVITVPSYRFYDYTYDTINSDYVLNYALIGYEPLDLDITNNYVVVCGRISNSLNPNKLYVARSDLNTPLQLTRKIFDFSQNVSSLYLNYGYSNMIIRNYRNDSIILLQDVCDIDRNYATLECIMDIDLFTDFFRVKGIRQWNKDFYTRDAFYYKPDGVDHCFYILQDAVVPFETEEGDTITQRINYIIRSYPEDYDSPTNFFATYPTMDNVRLTSLNQISNENFLMCGVAENNNNKGSICLMKTNFDDRSNCFDTFIVDAYEYNSVEASGTYDNPPVSTIAILWTTNSNLVPGIFVIRCNDRPIVPQN